jgi:hypothetical protein
MMTTENDQAAELPERDVNATSGIDGNRIISYNLSEGERPDGIKVRYKIRVVTGPRAKALDRAQAEVLREVLQWSRTRRQQQQER